MSKLAPMPRGGKRDGAGRPPKPKETVYSDRFAVRCTTEEKEKLKTFLEQLRKPG